jgi:serine/threonine-protein kinase RsbW
MAEPPNVRLILASRADNVSLVRELLSGIAEVLEVGAPELDRIRTAVSEACNNVVLHAYRGIEGPLEVEVRLGAPDTIAVVVRDRGEGVRRRIRIAEDTRVAQDTPLGVGLTVIEALARRVEFRAPSDGAGTEVRMEFDAPGMRALAASSQGNGLAACAPAPPDGEAVLVVSPAQLAPRMLTRMLGVLATQADFHSARISEVQLLADRLLKRACPSPPPDHLGAAVKVAPRELQLRIGPLEEGTARREVVSAALLGGLGQAIELPRERKDHPAGGEDHPAGGEDHPFFRSIGFGELFAVKLVDRRIPEPSTRPEPKRRADPRGAGRGAGRARRRAGASARPDEALGQGESVRRGGAR